MIRPKRSVRGAAATIALTSGISVVAPAVIGSVAHAANTQTMYTTADVNVRSASSNSGRVLTVAARGQSVKVTGEKVRGWVPVAVNGTSGWIYQRYLTEENVHPVHFGSDPLPDTMIAAVPVNVRSDSANAGKVLTVAERGQQVQITGRPDGGWVPVSVNGKSGWIYGRSSPRGRQLRPPPSQRLTLRTTLRRAATRVVQPLATPPPAPPAGSTCAPPLRRPGRSSTSLPAVQESKLPAKSTATGSKSAPTATPAGHTAPTSPATSQPLRWTLPLVTRTGGAIPAATKPVRRVRIRATTIRSRVPVASPAAALPRFTTSRRRPPRASSSTRTP
ncbi:SH3 domain protein [Cutibacterium acnes HL027PA1]|nr:SH3 domain protein [Cutibacterium acnes HL027PA1]